MNKDTIIGFVLIALVLIGFSWYNQPSQEEMEAARKQDSIATVMQQDAAKKQKAEAAARKAQAAAAAQGDTTALFYAAQNGKNQPVVLKNDKVELTFNTKGGTLAKAVIKNFENLNDQMGVTLFDENTQQMNFMLAGKSENIITKDLFFTPSNVTDSTLTMTALAGNGGSIEFNYVLGKDYMLHFNMKANGLQGMFAPNYQEMSIEWTDLARQQEKGFTFENRYTSVTYKEKNGGTDYLSETSEKIDENIDEALDWVAFKNQFFSAALIAKDEFAANSLLTSIPQQKGSGYLKQFNAKLKTTFDPTGAKATEFEMYIGPNDFRLIKDVEQQSAFGKDLDLEQLVNLGWWLVRWINRWFTIYVFDWLTSWGFSMGIVLILITLLLKVITFPMVKKSYMSSAKMRVLKPKLDEATKQYDKPEDQMKKQQAMMQLYSQYGVSPLGGCLPMLLQWPVLIALFYFFPTSIELRGESFLWAHDLSTYDAVITWDSYIPVVDWIFHQHISLFCILMTATNIFYTWLMQKQNPSQQSMPGMKAMMYLMPLMFLAILNNYSAGLSYYYFLSTLFGIIQTYAIRLSMNEPKILEQLKYNLTHPKKKSEMSGCAGLAAKAQEAQKLQQQQMKAQARKQYR